MQGDQQKGIKTKAEPAVKFLVFLLSIRHKLRKKKRSRSKWKKSQWQPQRRATKAQVTNRKDVLIVSRNMRSLKLMEAVNMQE